jgi:DNA-directed RNA polymerase subunit K/omega
MANKSKYNTKSNTNTNTNNKKESNIKKSGAGLNIKDDPDKLDKDDFDSNKQDDDETIVEDEEAVEEEGEGDGEGEEEEAEEEEVESEAEEAETGEKDEDEGGEEGGDDSCLYRITKKKTKIELDIDAVGEDNFDDEEEDDNRKKLDSIYVKPIDRITKPFLFDFERVRILGERARQLSLGAKPMLKNIESFDPELIARMELEQKIIPLIILRELPDGRIEKWKVNELSY